LPNDCARDRLAHLEAPRLVTGALATVKKLDAGSPLSQRRAAECSGWAILVAALEASRVLSQ